MVVVVGGGFAIKVVSMDYTWNLSARKTGKLEWFLSSIAGSVLPMLKQTWMKGAELICDVWSPHSTLKGTGVRDDPYIQTYQRKSLDETCKELCDWVSNVPKLKRTIQLMFQHWSVLEKRGKALCENHRIYLFISSKNQLKPDVCVLLCVLCGSLQCNLARSQVYLTSSCVQKVISSALAQ